MNRSVLFKDGAVGYRYPLGAPVQEAGKSEQFLDDLASTLLRSSQSDDSAVVSTQRSTISFSAAAFASRDTCLPLSRLK